MQQLVELGYIEKPNENVEKAVLKTKCDLSHNLARVYLGKKDFEKSKQILLNLINDDYPKYTKKDFSGERGKKLTEEGLKLGDSMIDLVPYYLELLNISLIENDFDLAEVYFNKIKFLDKRFAINLFFSEAKILLNKGRANEALKILEEAKNNKPNSEVWYQIGKIYRRLSQFSNAKQAFEKGIKLEADRAKLHQALAETLIRLEDYEIAAEHAIIAIELVKYYPEAHYTLGEALEKLGDAENAKIAYETAAKLKPITHYRAETAIENIKEELETPIKFIDKAEYKYREDQIVIVSGLPRSGTSLMMQMLNKGGVEILTDQHRKSDESNPKGYFEFDPVMSIHKDNTWLEKAQNKSVKVVAPLLKFLDPKFRFKVIFMNRDLTEIVKSQQKMIGKNPDILPVNLFEAYKKHLNQVETWKNKEPGVELIYVNYRDVLENPEEESSRINKFLGLDLNPSEMATCIDKSLYRNKN
jgi:tetratricopeptide (TPR) repeat protein